ncbi:MAG: hypothetical protein D6702_11380 [Planctomycetota bacterium]|nr:MAG: hypothetical protein D6702_11380 [Planctomycetota bacterium]
MPTPIHRLSILSLLVVGVLAGRLSAQQEDDGFRFLLQADHAIQNGFDDNLPGLMWIAGLDLEFEYGFAIDDSATAVVGLGAEGRDYHFTPDRRAAGTAVGDLFPPVGFESLYGGYRRDLGGGLEVLAAGRVMTGHDYGADVTDTFSGTLIAGAMSRTDEDFSYGFAVGAASRLGSNKPIVWPIPLVEWRLDDRWTLSSRHVFRNLSGFADLAGVRAWYQASEDQDCWIGAGWRMRQYRLDDGPAVTWPGAAVFESRWSLAAGTVWRAQHNASFFLDAGVDFHHRFDATPQRGPAPTDVKTDWSPWAAVGMEYRF